MKSHSSFLLPLLLLALAAQPLRGQVYTYPAPEGVALSPRFEVSVRQGGGAESPSPVYPCRVANPTVWPRAVEEAAFTQFSFVGDSVEVRVSWLGEGPIDSVRVRPLSLGIRAEVEDGRTVRFRLGEPHNVSVEVNGDLYHNLMVFACPAEHLTGTVKKLAASQTKKAAAGKGTKAPTRVERKGLIYFGPGVHELAGGQLRVPSRTTVYVAGGAVLKGQLLVDSAEQVRIGGRGVIMSGREGIYVRHSRDVAVDGLVMTQLPVGQSERVSITNVKTISSYAWGDGLNVFASSHVSYDRCFARTSDDCTTVYATRKGFSGSSRHISMDRCVLWADVGHPIFIGLHGNVERPDTIEHLRYRDIDILGQTEQQTDYQGCMAFGAGDLNLVRHVEFSDIRVEDIREGQLINLRTTWNAKYCSAPGRAIEDVTFRNVSYRGRRPNLSILAAYSPEHPVRDIRFENLQINGRHVFDSMPGKPKWYKTSDLANMYVGENVSGVTFE